VGYTTIGATTVNGDRYQSPAAMYTSAISDKNALRTELNNEVCDYLHPAAIDLFNDATHFNPLYYAETKDNMGSLNVYTP
jgi:hypothetical protein